MFNGAHAFNQDISRWNVAAVINVNYMFRGAFAFDANIGLWNTTSVITCFYTFQSATSFNQNIASWNTASVSNMASVRPLVFPIAIMRGVWVVL